MEQVTLEHFKLIRSDSHIVSEPVEGYTVTINNTHYLTLKALREFPALRVSDCSCCIKQFLNKNKTLWN